MRGYTERNGMLGPGDKDVIDRMKHNMSWQVDACNLPIGNSFKSHA